MRIGVIKTDGGEHSPELMASACAGEIMHIDPSKMGGPRLIAAQRLELKVVEALIAHHAAARDMTKESLAADSAAHFARSDLLDPGELLEKAIADVQASAAGTPWEADFRDPAKASALRQVIGQFLVDMMHLERLYHRDRNPDDLQAKAYGENPTGVAVIPLTEG
jgi:uncharacterized protein (DUF305 family)